MLVHASDKSPRLIIALVLVLMALGTITLWGAGHVASSAGLVATDEIIMEPAGHYGGVLNALAAPGGDFVFIGEGNAFTVLDVSDASQPTLAGNLPFSNYEVMDIAIVGNTAYVVNGAGLDVVDIGDPHSPALVGHWDTTDNTQGVFAAGATVYVTTYHSGGGRLFILDVSNPAAISVLGSYDTPKGARAVTVDGATAYVTSAGLQILDISNPASPTLLGAYDSRGSGYHVQVVGTTAYLADGWPGLVILDVSDPTHPTVLSTFDPGWVHDVFVTGNIAYASGTNLFLLDVSNPASPTVLDTYTTSLNGRVRVAGNTAYLTGAGMQVLNVSDPGNVSQLGELQRPAMITDIWADGPGVWAPPLSAQGSENGAAAAYGYLIDRNQLWVVDLASAVPDPVAIFGLQTWGESLFVASDTGTGNRLAYVSEYRRVEIVNVTDPISPTLAGQYTLPDGHRVNDVFVAGQVACVTTRNGSGGSLRIVDVSNPISPTEVSFLDTAGDARRVFVAGSTAFVADGAAGLRLIDISNPDSPVELGHTDPPTTTATTDVVFVAGNQAYVGSNADTGWWLQVIDVSNAASPVVLDAYEGAGAIIDLDVGGGYAYAAVQNGGLVALDVSQPQAITAAATYPSPLGFGVEVFTPGSVMQGTSSANTMASVAYLLQGKGVDYNFGTEVIDVYWEPMPTRTPTVEPTATTTVTPTPECSFSGIVMPPQARSSCWVKPAAKACECGVEQVVFTAPALCGDWTFDHWAPGKVLQCPSEGNVINQGWFDPLPVVHLNSQWEKYFLQGISLNNCYNALVEWNGPPGYVDFWMNGRHKRVSAEPYRVCYDMGRDFQASNLGGRNILKAIAVNGKGRQSHPAILHPMVFPLPAWVMPDIFGMWGLSPLTKFVVYHSEMRFPSPEYEGTVSLLSWLPVVGGKWGIKKTQIRGRFKAKSDGSGSSKLYGQTGFFVGSSSKEGREREVVGFVSGQEKTKIKPGKGLQVEQATFTLGVKGAIKDKMGPVDLFPALKVAENWWFVGWLVRKFNSLAKLETAFEPQLSGTLMWRSVKDALEFDHGEITAAIKIEAGISLELWKDKLKAALYGGGIPRLTFQAPPDPSYLKEMGMKLYFGLKVIVWKFEARFQRGLYCWYPPGSCKSALAQAMAGSGLPNWRLAPRDYITADYATFTANSAAPRLRGQMLRPQTTEEIEIVHNASPLAEPDLDIANNGQQMLTWVHDDPAKPNGQGEEIYFTFWNGTDWTVAAGITNDHNEDFAPQVAFAGNGHAVAIWERSNMVQPITSTLDITFTQSLEIATSEWDGAGWSEPTLLTSNHIMDYAPQLARGQDGKVMAIWFSNSGQALVGDDDNPDSLYYAIWDGAAWSAPATAVATVTGTLDASLAYFGPQAVIVLSRDTDGDPATDGDSELFYTEWNGATWSELTRLTDDEVNDLAPQVVYDGSGQANVVWMKDEQLTHLANGWAGAPVPLWPDGSMILASYKLTVDPHHNLALVYQALSENGNANINYTIYDEVNGLWGLADRLTDDQPLEDYLTPAFAADGTLWIAYTKVETLFEDKEVEIEGEIITVADVPVPGRSDLYLLRHTIDQDLAISADDIALSLPNPAPGQTVVISATVHSTGDLAVTDGKARFYDGDPALGGVQIAETQLLVSPLRAGITDTVSVEWTVSDTPTSHDIFVAVDPLQEIVESDEGNNVAHTTTVLPDLLVGDLYVAYVTPQTIQITTTVANSGTIPAADVRVEWHQDTITGTLLAAATVDEIAAGDSQDVGMSWGVSVADAGEHLVYAVVDTQNTITENDETNNSESVVADVLPDLTVDGSYLKLAYDAEPPATPITVSVTLHNEGVADAENVRLRIAQGDPFTDTSPVLYETVTPLLKAGEDVVIPATISITGWGDVYAIADPDWEIEEIYKGNNLALLVDFPTRIYLPLLRK